MKRKGKRDRMTKRNRFSGRLPLLAVLSVLAVLMLIGCRAEKAERAEQTEQTEQTEPEPSETAAVPEPEEVGTVVMLGDSLTEWGDFSRYFASIELRNLGIAGDTITGVTERVDQVGALNPDLLLIQCGINSLADDRLSACLDEYETLAAKAAALGEIRIVLQSVLPISEEFARLIPCSDSTIQAFNDGLRKIADEYGFGYLDLYGSFVLDGAMDPALTTDGLHLNEKGYDIWAEIIRPYIEGQPRPDAR